MANTVINYATFLIQGDGSSLTATIPLGYTPTSAVLIDAANNLGVDVSANISNITISGTNLLVNFVAAFSYLATLLINIQPIEVSAVVVQPVSGTISVSNFPATQPVSGTIAATQSGTWNIGTITTVTTVAAVTAITNALPAGANTIGKVDLLGNAGAILDGVITAATAPANGLVGLSVYESTAPSLTTGQSVAQQCDYAGSVFVKPVRRSQSAQANGTIASTTAATMLAAQGSGIFADLASLVLTVTAVSTAAIITVNISDGTNTYKFATAPNQSGTGTSAEQVGFAPFTMNWNIPIPATTANVAWTIALSAADCTVAYVATFTLQKAS
jgi:hypothetical protein